MAEARDLFLEGPGNFSGVEIHSIISNLMIAGLFYSRILNIKRFPSYRKLHGYTFICFEVQFNQKRHSGSEKDSGAFKKQSPPRGGGGGRRAQDRAGWTLSKRLLEQRELTNVLNYNTKMETAQRITTCSFGP